MSFDHIVVLNIDGLRHDVFTSLQQDSSFLASFFSGGRGVHLSPISPAPSITFVAQATITTGEPPDTHGIPGNQFLDRFGVFTQGKPKFYALDVARGVKAFDAAKVFREPGLANQLLSHDVSTIYELAAKNKRTSLCAYHMYSRGAHYWLRPSLLELYLVKKGAWWWRWFPHYFEVLLQRRLLNHFKNSSLPHLMMFYFLTLDTVAHRDGPESQLGYFHKSIAPRLETLVGEIQRRTRGKKVLYMFVSDHGHIKVKEDDIHCMKAVGGIPDDRSLIDALHSAGSMSIRKSQLCFGNNAGMGHLYVRAEGGGWDEIPKFETVLTVAKRILAESSSFGETVFSLILVRNLEDDGIDADFKVLAPNGELFSLEVYFRQHPQSCFLLPTERLQALSSALCGDILLVPNAENGFTFGAKVKGNHGGLSPDESICVFSLAAPGFEDDLQALWMKVQQARTAEPVKSELEYLAEFVRAGFG